MSRRLALRLGWQVAVSAAFVALGLWLVDLRSLMDAIRGANLLWVPPALLLFTAAKYVDSWRWRYLLRGVHAPPQRALFGAFLIGNMANNLLPLRAGDIAKIQVLGNRYGTSRAALAGSVFVVEATLDGVVFVLFLLAGVAFFGVAELPQVGTTAVLGLATAAVAAFGAALLLAHRWRRLPLPGRVARTLDDVEAGLHALGSPLRVLGAIALSLPAWLIESSMFALLGQAFGLEVGFATFVAVMIAANLSVAVPLGLWSIGPYEALVSGVLAVAGVETDLALSYAVTAHLLVNVWVDATGLAAFLAMRVSPREVFTLQRRPRIPVTPDGAQRGETWYSYRAGGRE